VATGKAVRPIIVIKKKVGGAGHHGGAWKVAYADFMTAMMSLFIVLWLLNTTPQIKKAVAGYFNDPSSSYKETGTKVLGSGESVSIDQKNVQDLKEQIEKAILRQTDLSKLSKQIEITMTGEGLRIELIEDKGGTFFESGSAKLSESGVKLLSLLADQLKVLPNHLLIEGHTDAQPYSGGNAGYSNWELSSDRANSARRLLQDDGLRQDQISQVRGFADQSLRVPSNPLDPSNRRISLIVQWAEAPDSAKADATSGDAEKTKADGTANPQAEGATAATTSPAPSGKTAAAPAETSTPPIVPAQTAPAIATPKPPAAKATWSQRIVAMIPGKKK
jgi:chemotaxis protein MotB